MDLLSFLRDPLWQFIGAMLTLLSIILAIALSREGRRWISVGLGLASPPVPKSAIFRDRSKTTRQSPSSSSVSTYLEFGHFPLLISAVPLAAIGMASMALIVFGIRIGVVRATVFLVITYVCVSTLFLYLREMEFRYTSFLRSSIYVLSLTLLHLALVIGLFTSLAIGTKLTQTQPKDVLARLHLKAVSIANTSFADLIKDDSGAMTLLSVLASSTFLKIAAAVIVFFLVARLAYALRMYADTALNPAFRMTTDEILSQIRMEMIATKNPDELARLREWLYRILKSEPSNREARALDIQLTQSYNAATKEEVVQFGKGNLPFPFTVSTGVVLLVWWIGPEWVFRFVSRLS